ncbi:MAG: nucleotidyltransferase domain-containing protein, partial [Alphaproteobacteria bacterium]
MAESHANTAKKPQKTILPASSISSFEAEYSDMNASWISTQFLDSLKQVQSEIEDAEFRKKFLDLLKITLNDSKDKLAENLYKTKDGAEYVGAHAVIMDRIISVIHATVAARFGTVQSTKINGLSILAVGGYGRGELSPYSDIDLLFLYKKDRLSQHQQVIEYILYLLWDLGLKVGHSSRTIDQCLEAADQDVTIMTTLLEIRHIHGDAGLFKNFETRLRIWMASKPVSYFVTQKLQERDTRHKQHGATRYMVEPQIKEGKGGLRDLHTLFWIAKFAYKVNSVEEIIEHGVLRVSEAKNFASSQRFLWTVRCFLHLRSKREDDRLTFDAQIDIAPLMGFSGRAGMRGVERFMKRYFLAARQVGTLTRIFCAAIESDFENKGIFGLGR